MENTIAHRVADFLQTYSPFDLISSQDLLGIAQEVQIRYVPQGKVIFDIGEQPGDRFFIVYRGAVTLRGLSSEGLEIIDQFDEGDVFGLRPLFAHEKYVFQSVAQEESILYAIPIELFRPIADNNREVGIYLMESFASNTENPYTKEMEQKFFSESIAANENLFELQPVNYIRNVLTCSPAESIQQASQLMKQANVSSIIVTKDNIPKGIVHLSHFRNLIADASNTPKDAVSTIMDSPVISYPETVTIAQAQTSMMKHGIKYICITEDGTPNTKLLGMVTDDDIIVMQANNPSALMRATKRSQSTKELKQIRGRINQLLENYIMQNLPLMHTSRILFELNDASIKRIIDRCLEKMGEEPPVAFAWMSLGSQGRKEQLIQTDQDNAIVFEDVEEERLEEVRNYFLRLAKKVNKRLHKIGFDYCEADIMARNPRWCLSISEWKNQFNQWTSDIGDDELLLSSIFFDFDISYGDVRLTNALSDTVFALTGDRPIFMKKLAVSALRSPSPLSFFRTFLVERDGKYKDSFDLKLRALMPMIDAGRLLALSHQIKNTNNTFERFERLASLEPQNAGLFHSCSYAFKALMKFRTKSGLIHHDSGRYISVEEMSKEERMKLKRCFKSLSQVQELIAVRYQAQNIL